MKSKKNILFLMMLLLSAFSLVNCGGGGGGGGSSPPPADTNAPTIPSGVTANVESTAAITITWNASTDNVGVTGYKVFRNASLIVTISPTTLTYTDSGLSPATKYSYTVSAYDAAGNESSQSSPVEATTSTPQTTQLGSTANDSVRAIAVDGSGNYYVVGYTEGSLDGNTYAGLKDIFLAKYDSLGAKIWVRQLGTSADEAANAVAVDGSGNVYVAGYTRGTLDGTNAGGADIFLAEYDSNGTQLWKTQVGTTDDDIALGLAVDNVSGDFYVVGYTTGVFPGATNAGGRDIFFLKYLSSKTLEWRVQLGTTANEEANGVALDGSGNIYFAGYTEGNLSGKTNAGGRDSFLKKYNYNSVTKVLSPVWDLLRGTAQDDVANGVAVDGSGNVYVTGYTTGNLDGTNSGLSDIFLEKYDSSGIRQWTRQLGTPQEDSAGAIVVDSVGSVYISGYTSGGLDGHVNEGASDFFLAKYDTSGTKQWVFQDGTSVEDIGRALDLDNTGSFVYLAGDTAGSLYGKANSGGSDFFVGKFNLNGVMQ